MTPEDRLFPRKAKRLRWWWFQRKPKASTHIPPDVWADGVIRSFEFMNDLYRSVDDNR